MEQVDVVGGAGIALGFLLGIVAHEFAHARAAVSLGDGTPRLMGRLTLAPRAHADPLGSIILPAIFAIAAVFGNVLTPMFGWGKRHAFGARGFRNPRRDALLVAFAGPGATLALAIASGAVARRMGGSVGKLAFWVMTVNLFLTVVDLLPIPGRDGARILARFLSPHAAARMEELAEYELLFLLGLFFLLGRFVNNLTFGLCDAVVAGICS